MAEDDESSKPEDSKSKGLAPVAHSRSMRARTRDWDLILDSQERALGETRDIMSKIAELLGEKGEDGGEMSKQLERLETQFDSLNTSVTEIKVAIGKIDTRIEGLDKNVVTKGQAATWALGGALAIFGAGWWVVQQYLAPILAHIPK